MNLFGNAAFCIGKWRVDPALDELSREGTTIKLEPRTMRVLVCLAERAGEVVSVNELLETVWKDLVVTQSSVYQAIAVLRRALGDNPRSPTYIASVLRRGYRLIAPIEPDGKMADLVTLPAEGPVGGDSDSEEKPAPVMEEARALAPEAPEASEASEAPETPEGGPGVERRRGLRYGLTLIALLLLAGGVWWFSPRFDRGHLAAGSAAYPADWTSRAEATNAVFTPPPHSVAVLPFTNLSGDPKQEYFSDGMTEELINALAQVDALRVTARTSSFSFKGKDADIATIARQLNVAVILEGSVRRSGNKVRITAQLVNGVNGFHTWSQDYDRDLNDVLNLQTDIATAVARELQAKLLGDEAPRIELGGTRNSDAFDAYLRGSKALSSHHDASSLQSAIDAFTDAIRLDPNYALAFAGRSQALSGYASDIATGTAIRDFFDKAESDARQAIKLAPELAEGHFALANFLDGGSLDFIRAGEAYQRAMTLAPGNATALGGGGRFAAWMGRFEAGIAAVHRAAALDPLNPRSRELLGQALYFSRRYKDAVAAFGEVISLEPEYTAAYGWRGLGYYGLGDFQSARTSCESKPNYWVSQWCLALVYEKLGRPADAKTGLKKWQAASGNSAAYQWATIYAQWGNTLTALEWLETASRVRDPGLEFLKTDPLMDPLRNEPRFQAIVRQLRFPE